MCAMQPRKLGWCLVSFRASPRRGFLHEHNGRCRLEGLAGT